MRKVTSISILSCCLVLSVSAYAFDNEPVINRPNFNNENFLDINSVHFAESQDEQWRQSANGWRMTGHSLSGDLLHTQGELKFMHGLSDSFRMYFSAEQEYMYADVPPEDPLIEMEYFPFAYPLSVSFMSTTTYKKSEVDMGFALTLGDRLGDFIRIEKLTVDKLFNIKNSDTSIDNASYDKFQGLFRVKAYYAPNDRLSFFLDWQDASEMVFNLDDEISRFTNSGHQYSGYLKYRLTEDDSLKVSLRGFVINKSMATTGSDQTQKMDYQSIHLKWMTRQQHKNKIDIGLRYDLFTNLIIDTVDVTNDIDYSFKTTQVYISYLHPYSDQAAWNTGVYIGKVAEPFDPQWTPTDINKDNIQSQLRLSWLNASLDKKSSLQLHLSINLDDIVNDIGDGYGMTYQYVF